MTVSDWKAYIAAKQKRVDGELDRLVAGQAGHLHAIFEAMRYSLFAGGKRLRPALLMAGADSVGGNGENYVQTAAALEMIHTYSLIHDDLPAMDNDDYRRGKLTNHKVFGDGMAVLAGDGLLTLAFQTIVGQPGVAADILLKVAHEISFAAGPWGMVGGQAMDCEFEDSAISPETLRQIHRLKTGALFRASIRSGAILAGADNEALAALTDYAEHFGLAFQITDDILDVTGDEAKLGKPIGSDVRNQKSTYVSLYSLEGAQKMAAEAIATAIGRLSIFGDRAYVLRGLAEYLLVRDS